MATTVPEDMLVEDWHRVLVSKEKLTKGEHRYVQSANDLRLAREHYLLTKSLAENEDPDDDDDELLDDEDGEDDEQMTALEYANSLDKEEIQILLDERGVEYSPAATKADLVPLLVAEIEVAQK